MSKSKLTIKQEKFVLKYFECGNASEAYRHAFSASKMKADTIHKRASELLANGEVAGRLAELQNKAEEESRWTVKKLIDAQTEIFEAGMGRLRTNHLVTKGLGDGVSEPVNMDMYDTNLSNAKGALIEIGKLIGAYEKDNSQKAGEMDIVAMLKKVAK